MLPRDVLTEFGALFVVVMLDTMFWAMVTNSVLDKLPDMLPPEGLVAASTVLIVIGVVVLVFACVVALASRYINDGMLID